MTSPRCATVHGQLYPWKPLRTESRTMCMAMVCKIVVMVCDVGRRTASCRGWVGSSHRGACGSTLGLRGGVPWANPGRSTRRLRSPFYHRERGRQSHAGRVTMRVGMPFMACAYHMSSRHARTMSRHACTHDAWRHGVEHECAVCGVRGALLMTVSCKIDEVEVIEVSR